MRILSLLAGAIFATTQSAAPAPVTAAAAGLEAQSAKTGFLSGYLRARPIIDQLVSAEGGLDAVRSLRQIHFRYTGSNFDATQTFDAHEPAGPGDPLEVTSAFDYEDKQFYQLTDAKIRGLSTVASPTFYTSGNLFSFNNHEHQFNKTSTADFRPAFDTFARYVPVLIIRQLLDNLSTAEWVGTRSLGGREMDVIEFSWNAATRYQLDIDKANHKLRALRLLYPDVLVGDDEATITFLGDRTEHGLWFPERVVSYRRGQQAISVELAEVNVNTKPDPALFQIPSGFQEVPSVPFATTKVASNLYQVGGIGGGVYRSQFIDMGDFVVAFEAPLNASTTERVIGEIRKTVGDKPIKYVVLSHFHGDHAGGVGAYVRRGTSIITTPGNEEILTGYARGGSILSGGSAHPETQPAFIDVAGSKMDILGTNGRKLVVYRIPNVPHVKGMLTLYDPATRTILNGDLFASFFPFSPTYQRFAEWLQSREAPPVDTIAGVHHDPISKSAFLRLAALSAGTMTHARGR